MKYYNLTISFLILFFSSLTVDATSIDSLIQKGIIARDTNQALSLELLSKARKQAKLSNRSYLSQVNRSIGITLLPIDSAKARKSFIESWITASSRKDSAKTATCLASFYFDQTQYDSALYYFSFQKELVESEDEHLKALSLLFQTRIYEREDQIKKAYLASSKAASLFEALGDDKHWLIAMVNQMVLLHQMEQMSESTQKVISTIRSSTALDSYPTAALKFYRNYSRILFKENNLDLAFDAQEKYYSLKNDLSNQRILLKHQTQLHKQEVARLKLADERRSLELQNEKLTKWILLGSLIITLVVIAALIMFFKLYQTAEKLRSKASFEHQRKQRKETHTTLEKELVGLLFVIGALARNKPTEENQDKIFDMLTEAKTKCIHIASKIYPSTLLPFGIKTSFEELATHLYDVRGTKLRYSEENIEDLNKQYQEYVYWTVHEVIFILSDLNQTEFIKFYVDCNNPIIIIFFIPDGIENEELDQKLNAIRFYLNHLDATIKIKNEHLIIKLPYEV